VQSILGCKPTSAGKKKRQEPAMLFEDKRPIRKKKRTFAPAINRQRKK
jgi:hypothetical protein